MKKLVLSLFICFIFTGLNAQQQPLSEIHKEIKRQDSIYVLKSDTTYTTFKNPVQFNSFLQLKVHELSRLFQLSAQERKPVTLFLEGIEMDGIIPVGTDKSKEVLFFILHRDRVSMKQWQLVGKILQEKRKKELLVSVGLQNNMAYPSSLRLTAELSRAGDYYLAFLTYAFAIILFSFLVKRSNTLRQNRTKYSTAYSLPITLIALWIFVVLFSILFLMASINSFPHVTSSVMMLLGISVFSSLAALSIENSGKRSITQETEPNTKSFILDLISDTNGINIFYLQLILTTILTGSYFIVSVISKMLLPDIDTGYLVLFGVSHLIYLVFKWVEKKNQL